MSQESSSMFDNFLAKSIISEDATASIDNDPVHFLPIPSTLPKTAKSQKYYVLQ